jgi:hypothetical protein
MRSLWEGCARSAAPCYGRAGRDLILSPRQDGGPVSSMAKAYVEVDGQSVPDGKGWTRTLTFVEKK